MNILSRESSEDDSAMRSFLAQTPSGDRGGRDGTGQGGEATLKEMKRSNEKERVAAASQLAPPRCAAFLVVEEMRGWRVAERARTQCLCVTMASVDPTTTK
mmetsp:Transcript_36176/g.108328  ORF Transcript_36176/g.108328 Transcript_36176/m.108328 type:complete len:101 (-) Transcript_36176:392-694(-)